MSALIYVLKDDQVCIAADTLMHDNHEPVRYVTKIFVLPHLRGVIAGTGLFEMILQQYVTLQRDAVIPDLQWFSAQAPAHLRRLAAQLPFDERGADFSSDGKWIAYQSNESGRSEIYIRSPSDTSGERWIVSTGGGSTPRWAPNGKELYYRNDSGVYVSRIDTAAGVRAGRPILVFNAMPDYRRAGTFATFAPSPDGRTILFVKYGAETTPTQVSVAMNFAQQLRQASTERQCD